MNTPKRTARFQLFHLWLIVFAFTVATTAIEGFGILQLNLGITDQLAPRWVFFQLAFFAVPAIALAPLLGGLVSAQSRWLMLMMGVLGGLAVTALTAFGNPPNWLGSAGLATICSLFFTLGWLAAVPECAWKAKVSLPQILAVFAVAVGSGWALGNRIAVQPPEPAGMAVQLQIAFMGYGSALLGLLLVRVAPEHAMPWKRGFIRPFFSGAKSILRKRYACNAWIALQLLFLIGTLTALWLLGFGQRFNFIIACIIGVVVGGLNRHPFRSAGLFPYATIGMVVCVIWGALSSSWTTPALILSGLVAASVCPLITLYTTNQRTPIRGFGVAFLFFGWGLMALVPATLVVVLGATPEVLLQMVEWIVVAVAVVLCVFAWWAFFRSALEMTLEILMWPLYRVKVEGPGVEHLPWSGPVIVIANHSAWLDPMWIGKILLAPTKPMMTSKFYDLPIISWFMRRIGTIRVPDVVARKEAPELKLAIAALDEDECVVIFPEGWLRRRENQELRRFGRGIWQILQQRPDIPVIACWIDGNWGSYTSFWNGPPAKNKRMDFWKTIRISVLEPRVIDPALLTNHLATRRTMMNACLEARALLGLPPIDPFSIPQSEDEPETDEKKEGEG